MIRINVESNIKEIAEELEKLEKEIPDALEDGLEEAAEVAVYMMKAEHFPNIDTGRLTSSVEEKNTGKFERTIGPWLNEDYPYYVEKGTKPHVITGNPYLYWEGADHPVRRVNHPGTRPYPYVMPTREKMTKEFPLILWEHVKNKIG